MKNPSNVTHQLSQYWQKIGFIAALCERHKLNHQLYSDAIDQHDNTLLYHKLLKKVWEYLLEQLTSMKNLEKALLQLEEIMPEPQAQDSYGVYPAFDAGLLLTSCLQMILDDSIDDVDLSANVSLATVTQFIVFTGEAEEDIQALQHPLALAELSFQNDLIASLTNSGLSKLETVKKLRKELSQISVSNLGIVAE
jgi:uncharacterized protein YjaG (DUF416 family)